MNSCRRCESLLSAYLDGELTGVDMMEVRSHLAMCPKCQEVLAEERMVRTMLASLATPAPGAEFENRLAASVLGPSQPSVSPWRMAGFTGAIVAAATMAAFFVFWAQTPSGSPYLTKETPISGSAEMSMSGGGDPLGAYMPAFTVADRTASANP